MYAAIVHLLQSYGLQYVKRTLGQVTTPLKIISTVDGENEVMFDNTQAKAAGKQAELHVNDSKFWLRLCFDFDLGFAEAYMLQEVDCNDLSKFFDIYLNNRQNFQSSHFLFQVVPRISRWLKPTNDRETAKLNIAAHYDTSNGLFTRFLSPDLNYSCAHWTEDPNESLLSAQRRKVHFMIHKAKITSSHHILDIGCGWGDLVIEAVKSTGCRATGLTLSEEQKSLAEERVADAGLQDRIAIYLCDYRNAPRPARGYDRVISVGMFEHVGAEYLDQYFATISGLLNPDQGVMVVDGITKINPFHEINPQVGEYIDRYVFPGGYIPTIHILLDSLHRGSKGRLEVSFVQNTGPHYGRTLLAWRDNFLENWDGIRCDFCEKHPSVSDGEIETYRRRWLYYFSYCEAGFRSRILGNYLICAACTPEPVVAYTTPVTDL